MPAPAPDPLQGLHLATLESLPTPPGPLLRTRGDPPQGVGLVHSLHRLHLLKVLQPMGWGQL